MPTHSFVPRSACRVSALREALPSRNQLCWLARSQLVRNSTSTTAEQESVIAHLKHTARLPLPLPLARQVRQTCVVAEHFSLQSPQNSQFPSLRRRPMMMSSSSGGMSSSSVGESGTLSNVSCLNWSSSLICLLITSASNRSGVFRPHSFGR